ncbi:hypothetical protein [Bacteroides sp. 51]|uniref:hypothetical protein n=1 Tax=Bacteroides sp. 51 TaxID=2302938 RepID=UPI0019402FE0|nr:hypothetical protein [Bacteroides sp. 51]NDV84499.1 hypothetical protein [Bacteroides sp. 51]
MSIFASDIKASMRIAIFLRNEKLPGESIVQAYAFSVEDHTITSIGSELLYVKNVDYLTVWLIGNNIDVLYMNNSDESLCEGIQKIGVKVKPLSEIKNNPLLNLFLIDYN